MALPQAQQPANIEEYVAASSLQEALRALADGAASPVAGGTDLWVQKDLGVRPVARRLVNIRRVPEIAGISRDGNRIRLGALVTMTEILESELLQTAAPLLPATADRFASVQVRNAATVGGNIVNASPAADMVIPLLCLDAEIELASWTGKKIVTRRLKLGQFFTGPGQSKRRPEELLTSVEFDAPGKAFRAGFCKTGPRPALEIAVVSLAFATYLKDGVLNDVRIALGAVAPTPIRCPKTEKMLQGKQPDDATIAGALDMLDGEISPIGDHRASQWYRRRLARVYLEQELSACR
jgi:CO/xanthine dehydrogenase FAD-binding subunit